LNNFQSSGFLDVFDLARPGVAAVVGAGGKSSLLGRFARELMERGASGLISVTTKLKQSQEDLGDCLIQTPDDDSIPLLDGYAGQVPLLIRRPLPEREKLDGVEPELVCGIKAQYTKLPICVEADGAAAGWLKVPGAHEPRIPGCSRSVIALTAFPVLRRKPDPSRIHRWDEYTRFCGGDGGGRFTPETAARLLLDPWGSFKGAPRGAKRIWFINQADSGAERDAAVSFVESVLAQPMASSKHPVGDRIVVGSLRTGEFHYIDPPH